LITKRFSDEVNEEDPMNKTDIIAVAISSSLYIGNVVAQSPSEQEEFLLEDVIVTSTRIKTDNTTSAQPMTSLDRSDFISSGALTAEDAMNQLPQLGDALEVGSSINSLNSGFGVGTQTVNLRGLGSNRTLVLVNGRRHIGGDMGTSAVDLNTIPAGLIERVDVVTGAGSAIYGADAVTGVVNVILKENYEGTELTSRFGVTGESDGDELSFGFTHGGVFESGDYILSAEYSAQNPILGADRPFAQYDGSASTGLSASSNGSGVNPGGLFLSANFGGTGGFDSLGQFVSPFAERFQRVPFRYLQNETDRLLISGRSRFSLTSDTAIFVEVAFARSEVTVQFDPQLAVFSDAGFSSSGTAGFRFPTGPTVAANSDSLRVITRRFAEFGPRSSEIERDVTRIAFGFDGAIGESSYEGYYQYGKVAAVQKDFNTIDKLRLATAIDPVACAAQLGCQFVNLYGRRSIDSASLAWISDDLLSDNESEQHIFNAYMTGDLFEFDGSNVAYVIGIEYRTEDVSVEPNDGLIAVDNPINPGVGQTVGLKGTRTFFGDTKGSYDVSEVFGELLVPVGGNAKIGLSARYSDYSTVGSEVTYGVNLNWPLSDWATVRASVGSATRAPNINELNGPDRVTTSAISDPCDTADDSGAALAPAMACSSFGGTYNPTDLDQQIRAISGGNPSLGSETADTYTIGTVFSWGNGMNISIDYFSIQMEDVLASAFGAQETLDRCIATNDSFFCDNVSRDPISRFVTSIRSEQVNLAAEGVKGIDLAFSRSFALWAAEGTFKVSGLYSHLLEHTRTVNDVALEEDLAGRVDNVEDKLNLTLIYETPLWNAGLTFRYLASSQQDLTADPDIALGNNVDSLTYIDFHGGIKPSEHIRLSVGIENLTDEESPVVTQLFENNGSADTTVAGIYDIRGRFYYLNAVYTF